MRYKLNIQNFAPAMVQVTINFDSNITKVALILDEETVTYEWTTSGQESDYLAFIDGTDYTFKVTLNDGYVLDTVTLLGNELQGTLKSKTDNSFIITAGSGAIGNITLTSKQSSSTTGINKLRLGSITPIKYYLGSKELSKMYLRSKLVYQKTSLPQLSTPQNVAVEDTTLSFDEVENATEYEVFVDNVSIGAYQMPKIKVYGVTGLGESSPTLTRTDDNIGLAQDSQELHDFFVANEDVTDSNGNHFVQLKKFFVKILGTDYVTGYQVSHAKIDDSYILCPMFYDKDGNEIDYAYYGKYKGYIENNKLYSQSGKTPTYSTHIDNFMTYARNNGSDEYYATDWVTAFTAQIMFMIVYASTKYEDYFTIRLYGSETSNTDNTSTFLGIEDMVGNGYEFLVNVSKLSNYGQIYYKDYIGEWIAGAITSGNYFSGILTKWGYQSKHFYNKDKLIATIFPNETSGSVTTFYCDRYDYSYDVGQLIYWGAGGSNSMYGLFYICCYRTWNNYPDNVGSRLCAKKLI